MKFAVVGSRGILDREMVRSTIESSPWFDGWDDTEIVSGGADGVDTSASLIAADEGAPVDVIKPDYSDWSRGHPAKVRNTRIVEEADVVVAVWDGHSNGTRDTIDKALDRGVPICVETTTNE